MAKPVSSTRLTSNLTITEYDKGYWLYDYTRGMNLSMRAKTPEDAFVEAITYYQKRTKKLEDELKKINQSVDTFINSMSDEDES